MLDFPAILANGTSVVISLQSASPEISRLFGSLITVSVELAAKARGEIPADKRTGTYALIIDEFQRYAAQSGESLTNILDECRKVGLYLVLGTQSYIRIPADIRGALSNADIRAVFLLEEPDAEAVAPLLHFPYNPHLAKQSATRTPRFYSRAEQQRHYIEAITRLPKRKAFLKLPDDRLYRMDAFTIEDPYIKPDVLAYVEEQYLRRYFVSQRDVEQEIANNLGANGVHPPLDSQPVTIPSSYVPLANDNLPTGENDDEEDELDEYRAW